MLLPAVWSGVVCPATVRARLFCLECHSDLEAEIYAVNIRYTVAVEVPDPIIAEI